MVIRVRAAGVDAGVWHVTAGQPYLLRVVGFGLQAPKQRIPGRDVAGVVTAVGEEPHRSIVRDRQPGDVAEYESTDLHVPGLVRRDDPEVDRAEVNQGWDVHFHTSGTDCNAGRGLEARVRPIT